MRKQSNLTSIAGLLIGLSLIAGLIYNDAFCVKEMLVPTSKGLVSAVVGYVNWLVCGLWVILVALTALLPIIAIFVAIRSGVRTVIRRG